MEKMQKIVRGTKTMLELENYVGCSCCQPLLLGNENAIHVLA